MAKLEDIEAHVEELEDRLVDVELQLDRLLDQLVGKTAALSANERKLLKRLQAARARLAKTAGTGKGHIHNPEKRRRVRASAKQAKKAYDQARKKKRR